MAETKKLVLVVENTAALSLFWRTIFSDYVEKIVRSFYGDHDKTAKRNPNEQPIGIVKNPKHLVLISEDFVEARVALTQPKITNMPPPSSVVKITYMPPPSRNVNPVVSNSGAITNKPPLGNSHLLNIFSQSRLIGENISGILNENTTSSVSVETPTGQAESATLPTGTTTGKRSLDVATNVDPSQQTTSALQSQPSKYAKLSEGNISSERQRRPIFASTVSSMASTQSSSTSQRMTSSLPLVKTVTSSGQASATLPRASTGTRQTTSALQTKRVTEYVKLWEGNLIDARQGQNIVITRLEGYKDKDASEPLAKDWPSTLQIEKILSPKDVKDKHHIGGSNYVVFKVKNEHVLLEELRKKNLYALVKLPLHTMLLYNASRLIGLLFPKDIVF